MSFMHPTLQDIAAVHANMEDDERVHRCQASHGLSPETHSGSGFAAAAICGMIVFVLLAILLSVLLA